MHPLVRPRTQVCFCVLALVNTAAMSVGSPGFCFQVHTQKRTCWVTGNHFIF